MVSDRIADQVIETGVNLPYVDGLAGLVKGNVIDLDAAISKSLGLELTPEVHAADDLRDKRYKSFRSYLEHKSYSEDPEIAEQASFLFNILKKHGLGLWYGGLTEQSIKLKALFNDLEDDKAKNAILKTGASPALEMLKIGQDNFEKIYRKRASEASIKEDPKVRDSRKKLTGNLQALLLNLTVAEKLNEDSEKKTKVASLIGEVNKIISSTITIARARISRSVNATNNLAGPEKPAA